MDYNLRLFDHNFNEFLVSINLKLLFTHAHQKLRGLGEDNAFSNGEKIVILKEARFEVDEKRVRLIPSHRNYGTAKCAKAPFRFSRFQRESLKSA